MARSGRPRAADDMTLRATVESVSSKVESSQVDAARNDSIIV